MTEGMSARELADDIAKRGDAVCLLWAGYCLAKIERGASVDQEDLRQFIASLDSEKTPT